MEFEEKLIEEVKNYPVLYKKTSGGYKNITKKVGIWKDIAIKLSSSDEICRTRWKSLRDKYCRELKKSDLPSGSGASDGKPENWKYFNHMSFLKDHIKPRRTIGNFDEQRCSVIQEDISSVAGSSNSSQLHNEATNSDEERLSESDRTSYLQSSLETEQFNEPAPKKSKVINVNAKLVETMTQFNSFLAKRTASQSQEQINTGSSSSGSNFGRAVTDIIGNLSSRNQALARAHILRYLSDLQFEEANQVGEY